MLLHNADVFFQLFFQQLVSVVTPSATRVAVEAVGASGSLQMSCLMLVVSFDIRRECGGLVWRDTVGKREYPLSRWLRRTNAGCHRIRRSCMRAHAPFFLPAILMAGSFYTKSSRPVYGRRGSAPMHLSGRRCHWDCIHRGKRRYTAVQAPAVVSSLHLRINQSLP